MKRAIDDRLRSCSAPRMAARFAVGDAPQWCRHESLRRAIADYRSALDDWRNMERLARAAVGADAWRKHADAAAVAAAAHGLSQAHGVVLRSYTDRDLDVWPLMNELARALPHFDSLLLKESDLYRAGLLIHLMDEALRRLPPVNGTFRRGVDPNGLGKRRTDFLKAHTRRGRVVSWEGYTSVMDGAPYKYQAQFRMEATSARGISAFSVGMEPELLLPRSSKFEIIDYWRAVDGVYHFHLRETDHDRPVRREHTFGVEASGSA